MQVSSDPIVMSVRAPCLHRKTIPSNLFRNGLHPVACWPVLPTATDRPDGPALMVHD